MSDHETEVATTEPIFQGFAAKVAASPALAARVARARQRSIEDQELWDEAYEAGGREALALQALGLPNPWNAVPAGIESEPETGESPPKLQGTIETLLELSVCLSASDMEQVNKLARRMLKAERQRDSALAEASTLRGRVGELERERTQN